MQRKFQPIPKKIREIKQFKNVGSNKLRIIVNIQKNTPPYIILEYPNLLTRLLNTDKTNNGKKSEDVDKYYSKLEEYKLKLTSVEPNKNDKKNTVLGHANYHEIKIMNHVALM